MQIPGGKEWAWTRAGFLSLGARGGAAVAIGAMTAVVVETNGCRVCCGRRPVGRPRSRTRPPRSRRRNPGVSSSTRRPSPPSIRRRSPGICSGRSSTSRVRLTAVSQVLSGAGQTPATATSRLPSRKGHSTRRVDCEVRRRARDRVRRRLSRCRAYGRLRRESEDDRGASRTSPEHWSVFSDLAANRPIGVSFPVPLDYVTVSDLLDSYLKLGYVETDPHADGGGSRT